MSEASMYPFAFYPPEGTAGPPPFLSGWHVIDEIDLAWLVSDHAAIDRLCCRLEDCADHLPEWPDPADADALCDELYIRFVRHLPREDRWLAALFADDMPQPLVHTLIDHIGTRHTACRVQAEDIVAALQPEAARDRGLCAEAFGYMLRCFFDGCRQAMAFEEMAILTLADKRLTPGARAQLTTRIALSCA